MITTNISNIFLIYLGLYLFVCLGAWFYSHVKQKRKTVMTPLHEVLHCEYCTSAYLVRVRQIISQCPHCKSFNKKNTK